MGQGQQLDRVQGFKGQQLDSRSRGLAAGRATGRQTSRRHSALLEGNARRVLGGLGSVAADHARVVRGIFLAGARAAEARAVRFLECAAFWAARLSEGAARCSGGHAHAQCWSLATKGLRAHHCCATRVRKKKNQIIEGSSREG